MGKKVKLLFLISAISTSLFAQFGQITSIQLLPANPTDADQVKAVVEVMLGTSPCTLDNSTSTIAGNSIQLHNFYCGGMLQTICGRTDTIDLGTLAAGTYNLAVSMAVGCGPYTQVDSSTTNSFIVSVFSGLSFLTAQQNFTLYPNPTGNSLINLQTVSSNPYSIICYNSIGQEAFVLNNLQGNQQLILPKDNGLYLIKIIDSQNKISMLRCVNQEK